MKFVFSYSGIKYDANCAKDWPVTVTVLAKDGSAKVFNNVIPNKLNGVWTSGGLAKYQVSLVLSNFDHGNNLAVFVKGPRHLQTKYGRDGQSIFYDQPGGILNVADDPNPNWTGFDFTGYPVMTGDINQDGVVNGQDFSLVKTASMTRRSVSDGESITEDLNGNCMMESQDVGLLMITLDQKQDQLY